MIRKRAGIVLFNDIEVLDFCGPFEVFSATRLDEETRWEEPSPSEVFLVAETLSYVTATGGMKVIPQFSFANCPKIDILVVPGGWGTRNELNNPVMLDWLRSQATKVEILTSVCTGSMLLGYAGLLDGLHATTHWRSLDWMRDSFPEVIVEHEEFILCILSLSQDSSTEKAVDFAFHNISFFNQDGTRGAAGNDIAGK